MDKIPMSRHVCEKPEQLGPSEEGIKSGLFVNRENNSMETAQLGIAAF
jgi:hypothetical protein